MSEPIQSFSHRVNALSASQKEALAKALQLSKPDFSPKHSHSQRLVAYVVATAGTDTLNAAQLRDTLQEQLPSYMVPSAVVPLKAFPYNANGKIDVRSLPALAVNHTPTTAVSAHQLTPPTTAVEKTLVDIWQSVLGIESIGIHDNFFELGGDSILSIQIVSKAREAKLQLAPNQLFEQPTAAALAKVVNLAVAVEATQSVVTGPVPLTPIQRWFFELGLQAPQHWHQGLLLSVPASVGAERVRSATTTLWQHHDALRLRFIKTTDARWQQHNADASNPPQPISIDLSNLSPAQQQQAVSNYGSKLHASTVLANANLLQVAHFSLGPAQPSWLLVSLHHLAVDGISWQILKDDLRTLLSPSPIQKPLPSKTTAFKVWAETLAAQSNTRRSELDFWLTQLKSPSVQLPASSSDHPSTVTGTEQTARTHTITLSEPDTRALLKTVPRTYNTQINDVLLTALVHSIAWWSSGHVNNSEASPAGLRIDLEAHGREQIVDGIDLSRTVGWFTTVCPVWLSLNETTDLAQSLKSIKEQLRQIPDKGIGYGILRYLGDKQVRDAIAQYPLSEVLFNYLGQREVGNREDDQHSADICLLKDMDLGVMKAPENRRGHLLEINAWVADNQLFMNWTYNSERFASGSIETVASEYLRTLKDLITHCVTVQRGGYTPSDFPDVEFTQSALDRFIHQLIQSEAQSIDAIYPLSPAQQSFLWHSLQTSSQAGLLHMRGTLYGVLDSHKLKQAWQRVIAHHPALRTSVHWEGVSQPVQVVVAAPPIPWQQLDYRDAEDPRAALAEFLESDRALGFNFTQSPITRLTLIQLAEQEYELIWTCHHLMLDGWSGTLVFHQVLATYETLISRKPPTLKLAPSYQSYVRWLHQQNEPAAKAYWQQQLQNFSHPTPLPLSHSSNPPIPQSPNPLTSQTLSPQITTQLNTFLRTHRLTLNTLIQGAWALLLAHSTHQTDVLFGATVSGRQAPIADVESIVGLLTNVLPIRVNVSPDVSVVTWLQTLQTEQAKTSRYAHAATAQIQSWSDCSRRLFDSLLVIENYPATFKEQEKTASRSLQLNNLQSGIISTYGLTVIVKPGEVLTLYADTSEYDQRSLDALLSSLKDLLNRIVDASELLTVESLLSSIEPLPQSVAQKEQQNKARDIVAASTPLELQLTKIWASVLMRSPHHQPLSITDNFFDLGGNSLLAVQLFNQMQQQLNCTLPLATLFQAPTVRQFATLLSQQDGEPIARWSSLVPIQTQGSRIPLFFHGGSADALTWARFSRLLGADQPFYALQRPDLDGSNITHLTVEALAEKCIQDIRIVQPRGPYLIGGHCFGGAVAFEIVRQLQAQGETVASLIQIDAYCPNAEPDRAYSRLQEQIQLGLFLLQKSYYYHASPEKLMQLPYKMWRQVWKRFQPKVKPSRKSLRSSPSKTVQPSTAQSAPTVASKPTSMTELPHSLPYEARYDLAHQANIRAADTYHPQQYSPLADSPIHIFQANVQILDWRYGPLLGWQTVSKIPVKSTVVPGIFGNLFNQKSGPVLAQHVRTYLDTLQ